MKPFAKLFFLNFTCNHGLTAALVRPISNTKLGGWRPNRPTSTFIVVPKCAAPFKNHLTYLLTLLVLETPLVIGHC